MPSVRRVSVARVIVRRYLCPAGRSAPGALQPRGKKFDSFSLRVGLRDVVSTGRLRSQRLSTDGAQNAERSRFISTGTAGRSLKHVLPENGGLSETSRDEMNSLRQPALNMGISAEVGGAEPPLLPWCRFTPGEPAAVSSVDVVALPSKLPSKIASRRSLKTLVPNVGSFKLPALAGKLDWFARQPLAEFTIVLRD